MVVLSVLCICLFFRSRGHSPQMQQLGDSIVVYVGNDTVSSMKAAYKGDTLKSRPKQKKKPKAEQPMIRRNPLDEEIN